MADKTDRLVVDLIARTANLERGLKEAQSDIGRFAKRSRSQFSRLAGAIRPLGGLIAGAFSVAAIKRFTEASDTQERAVTAMNAALARTGQLTPEMSKRMQNLASELQKTAGVGDEVTLANIALLQNLGQLSNEALPRATRAAVGLAEVMGVDAETAFRLMGRAAAGQFQLFTRYGIQLDETATDQEKFNQLLEIGTEGLAQAEAQTRTQAGQAEQLSMALGDLQEQLGDIVKDAFGLFLPGLQTIVGALSDAPPAVRGFSLALGGVAAALVVGGPVLAGIAALATAIVAIVGHFRDAKTAVDRFKEATEDLSRSQRIEKHKKEIERLEESIARLNENIKTFESKPGLGSQRFAQIAGFRAQIRRLTGDLREHQAELAKLEAQASGAADPGPTDPGPVGAGGVPPAVRSAGEAELQFNEATLEAKAEQDEAYRQQRISAEQVMYSALEAANSQFWASLANTQLTGAERWEAIQNAMLQAGLRMVGQLVFEHIVGERAKTAAAAEGAATRGGIFSAETAMMISLKLKEASAFIASEASKVAAFIAATAAIVASAIARAASFLAAGAASIAAAAAAAVAWLVSTLGPLGLVASVAAVGSIIAFWDSIKGMLGLDTLGMRTTGFEFGGQVPGTGGADSVPAMLTPGEIVAPPDDFIAVARDLLMGGGPAIPAPAMPRAASSPMNLTFNIQAFDRRGVSQAVREEIIPVIQQETKRGVKL
jgi:hypothetical protein